MPHIPPALDLISSNSSSNYFTQFITVLEQFVTYIKGSEGIQTCAIHPHEWDRLSTKFNSLPEDRQRRKLKRFVDYYEHCREQASLRISLKDKKQALQTFMKKFELRLPDEDKIFDMMEEDTFIEIYDLDFIQCYRSIDFLNTTSHSVMALETCEWWHLFDRSEAISVEIMAAVKMIYSQEIRRPIFNPVPPHTVKEVGSISPRSSQAETLLYSPVYDEDDFFQGGLHLFKVKSVYDLDFKVLNNC